MEKEDRGKVGEREQEKREGKLWVVYKINFKI